MQSQPSQPSQPSQSPVSPRCPRPGLAVRRGDGVSRIDCTDVRHEIPRGRLAAEPVTTAGACQALSSEAKDNFAKLAVARS